MFQKVISIIIATTIMLLCGCSSTNNNSTDSSITNTTTTTAAEKLTTSPLLTVSVINVKKADSILIQTQNHAVLIDTGTKDMSKTILNYLSDCGVENLDALIITHFHKDHVGSAAKILKKIDVESVIQPNYYGTNDESSDFISEEEDKNIVPIKLGDNYSFDFDNVSFTVSPANADTFDDFGENDRSLITSVYCGEKSFLFAGDIDESRITQMLNSDVSHYDFLKVEHHGFYASKNSDFITAVSPEYAVISNKSEDNVDSEVLNTLDSIGATTFITCNGTVKAVCDGKSISISYI